MPDGSFRHIRGGETNRTATQQVFYGCVAYLRFREGRPSLYELDAVREGRFLAPSPTVTPDDPSPSPDSSSKPTSAVTPGASADLTPSQNSGSPSDSGRNGGSNIPPYRLVGTGIILLLTAVLLAILALRKRLTRRNALLATIVSFLVLLLLWIVKIQTPQQYYDSLKVNDVITYKSGVQVVTHRIVKLLPDTKSVITRGDRNNMDDPSVNNENIIGRVKFSVPLAGYIVLFMNTRFGRIMTIIFVLALIGGSIIYRMASHEDGGSQDEPENNPENEPEADPQDETKENSSGNESSNE